MPEEYTIRVLSEEDAARQKTSFYKLLDKWGKAAPYPRFTPTSRFNASTNPFMTSA